MAESISRLGKEVRGRFATVVANVSNFVPKPQTPYQWNAMQRREYFASAHEHLRRRQEISQRLAALPRHRVESAGRRALPGRPPRRRGDRVGFPPRRPFRRLERAAPARVWWQALADAGIDVERILHRPYPLDAVLPWDHFGIRQGRGYLVQEQALAAERMKDKG